MKKIVKGNDFTLKIPVMKFVDGEKIPFPLPGCTDIHVRVRNQFRRIELAYVVDVKEDNVLLAKVEGDQIPLGTYALEVRGKIFGNDWRSEEYPQFAIVSKNADGDTEFGETDEGDNSVEMDSALIILPPTVVLADLINEANDTIKKGEKAIADIKDANAEMVDAENVRKASEKVRVDAENERVSNENSRVSAEEIRVSAETKREEDSAAVLKKCQDATSTAISDMEDKTSTAVAKCEQAVVDAQVSVVYDPDSYGIVITTGKEAGNG